MPVNIREGLAERFHRTPREPLVSFRELCEEFNVTPAKLRYAFRDENTPKAKLTHKANTSVTNSWYSPSEMRKWWENRCASKGGL